MVKKFNSLDLEYKQLPAVMIHGRQGTEVEKFEALKYRLRAMCLWEEYQGGDVGPRRGDLWRS